MIFELKWPNNETNHVPDHLCSHGGLEWSNF